ncbi:MAG: helix-turn-helix domain-containing protein [Novosphingobium sp.]
MVWNNDGFFGCRFEAPLSPATLSAIELRSAAKSESKAKAEPGDALPVLLLRLRKAKGLTLAAIAEGLGVSKPTVWAWEQGRARPTADRIAPLAALLGIEPERLSGEGDRSRLHAALASARVQVAEAFGVTPDRVRIMIDL